MQRITCAKVSIAQQRYIRLLINNSFAGGYFELSHSDTANILTLYPDAFTAA